MKNDGKRNEYIKKIGATSQLRASTCKATRKTTSESDYFGRTTKLLNFFLVSDSSGVRSIKICSTSRSSFSSLFFCRFIFPHCSLSFLCMCDFFFSLSLLWCKWESYVAITLFAFYSISSSLLQLSL